MKWLRYVLLLISVCLAHSQIIPAHRLVSWNPGVRGGIINRSVGITITDAPYSADSNGVLACDIAVSNALLATNYTAIYFPPGKYVMSNQLTIQNKSVTFRGAGSNLTYLILRNTNSTSQGSLYVKGASSTTCLVTNGMTRGSTTIDLTNASTFVVGDYVRLFQNNDTNSLEGDIPGGETTTSAYYQSQYNEVIAKSGITLTLRQPLYCTYDSTTNLYPRVQRFIMTTNVGFEDMYIAQEGRRDASIYFFQSADNWVKNVRSTNANWFHVSFDSSFRNTVASNCFHYAQSYTSGGYGVNTANSTDNLIENNVLYHLRHSIIIQNGASGNVVFGNYSSSMYATNPDTNSNYMMPDYEVHGGQAVYNLIEQNIGQQFKSDDYWGSDALNIFLRNHGRRWNDDMGTLINSGMWAFSLNALQLSNTVLGNVWLQPGFTGAATNEMGGTGRSNPSDYTRVTNTMIYHGNWDYSTDSAQWDGGIADRAITNSLFYTSKPGYWGDCNWPAFGPELTIKTNIIPAQAYWYGVSYPYYSTSARYGEDVDDYIRRIFFVIPTILWPSHLFR